MPSKFPCACCGYLTRSEEEFGTFEICPICGWEDDDFQSADENFSGGANAVSLAVARENYERVGAISEDWLASVRSPKPDEYGVIQ